MSTRKPARCTADVVDPRSFRRPARPAVDDDVSAISYRTPREVARIRVGDHPQRMRTGTVRAGLR